MLPLNRTSAETTPASRKSLRSVVSCSFVAALSIGVYSACAASLTSGTPTTADNEAGASGEDGGTGSSSGGTVSSSGTGIPMTGPSGTVVSPDGGSGSSSGSSGGSSSGTVNSLCLAPAANSSTLPFAVDSKGAFVPSGYEGDYPSVVMPADTTCGGNRSSTTALGACHTVNYNTTPDAGIGKGWAGVVWQYPANNWGTATGYLIPPGATTVSFWARGATGTESVSFNVGGIGYGGIPSATNPCEDTVTGSLAKSTLSTTWTHYNIPIPDATYSGGVLNGFSWVAGAADQPPTATEITFYVDDIEWQE